MVTPLLLHYPMSEHSLDNGLRVIVNPDQQSPAVAVNLWYRVGSADESSGRTGLAHLFEHLMFSGSANVASGEHLGLMQSVGAQVNATTSFDRTNYFETIPPGATELALWLEADRMTSLTVDQHNLATQRSVVGEEKRQRYDNVPYGDLMELLMALNFPSDHPYHHIPIGTLADLDAATLAEVQAFYRSWYSPSNASLVLSGGIDSDAGVRLAERYFGAIPASDVPTAPRPAFIGPHAVPLRQTVERDVPRAKLFVTWRSPSIEDADHDAIDQALAVLAGGQASRLEQRMVRDLDIAESVSAGTVGLSRGTDMAMISARARDGVDLRRLADVITEEIEALSTQGPSDAELDRACALYEREWLSELASVDSRADQINSFASLLQDPDRLNRHLAETLAVTSADVLRCAALWLAPSASASLHYTIGATAGIGSNESEVTQ